MELFYSVVMGIIEGLTEFIPVSSTGHLVITDTLLGFREIIDADKAKCFAIVIQLPAIMAIVVLYRRRFYELVRPPEGQGGFRGMRGITLLAITTTPALVAGYFLHDWVDSVMTASSVALALAVGAWAMMAVEWYRPAPKVSDLDSVTYVQALVIGIFQCFSLWSGMSRSGSTIIGAMLVRVDRRTAAEYSFLAAVPVMVAATGYKLFKTWHLLSASDVPYFALGSVASFVAAIIAVKGFLAILNRCTLIPFAVYRLILSAIVLLLLMT